ncbi:Subtilisin-like protease SBT5.4 [Thalictrum thalictroides]|uniref:Subtilisin-like protease SBT5.4 n=1 Tax=Thalictrum thalictroides TaxID=46969 RepID=A0A7J6X8V8_THATH|nr:Subtilisin-like protease SBT5.4 [Thalictrum thalictroides]
MLSAFEDVIHNGVDVLTLSIGEDRPVTDGYFNNTMDRQFTSYVCRAWKQSKVQGKIVIFSTDEEVNCLWELKDHDVAGIIIVLPDASLSMFAALISTSDGKAISAYINSTKLPTAYITQVIVELNTKPAPIPDIIAPGTQVIAASPDVADFFHQGQPYVAMSGTSMTTPIVAGVVALLKAIHPEWTLLQRRDCNPGLIQPNVAADPGLVYDLTMKDYLKFLCTQKNFTEGQLANFYEKPFKCPESYNLLNFNYPSITVPNLSKKVTVRRIVKNVGTPGIYNVTVTEPEGIFADVHPKRLMFNKVGEKKVFKLTLKAKKAQLE